MVTLRIEHAIHEYAVWKAAFDRFAEVREKAGVRDFVIRLAADDPKYLLLDLEFDTADQARAFSAFLQSKVWSNSAASPGLAGAPSTRILDVIAPMRAPAPVVA